MCFPLLDDRPEAAPPEVASAPPQPGLSHRILVVEDDADVRRVIVESLQMAGHVVTDAADGHAGLAALAAHPPDLLIVDYAMPLMNGAQVIQHARLEIPGLPVILATGYADMVEVGRVLGTQSILVKPFDISTLLDAVALAMRN